MVRLRVTAGIDGSERPRVPCPGSPPRCPAMAPRSSLLRGTYHILHIALNGTTTSPCFPPSPSPPPHHPSRPAQNRGHGRSQPTAAAAASCQHRPSGYIVPKSRHTWNLLHPAAPVGNVQRTCSPNDIQERSRNGWLRLKGTGPVLSALLCATTRQYLGNPLRPCRTHMSPSPFPLSLSPEQARQTWFAHPCLGPPRQPVLSKDEDAPEPPDCALYPCAPRLLVPLRRARSLAPELLSALSCRGPVAI